MTVFDKYVIARFGIKVSDKSIIFKVLKKGYGNSPGLGWCESIDLGHGYVYLSKILFSWELLLPAFYQECKSFNEMC